MLRMGLGMILLLAPLQLVIGDLHGLNTAEHQPAKLAAMEAHWDGTKPGDLVLFALPDAARERNNFELSIPGGASWIITGEADGLFPGLKDFAPENRPPVWPVFFAFRVMVGLGLVMILVGLVGGWLWLRGRLFAAPRFLRLARHVWPLGFIAILAGWWVAETGRQPWVAYNILRTADAASPVAFGTVLSSLILFVIVYSGVFSMGIYYINRLIERGPPGGEAEAPETSTARRPFSAATSAARAALEREE
jgi:cytochrome d ubiquinol oxidase subunit I